MEDTQTKNKIFARISAFLDKHFALFFTPILVAFVYIFALWQNAVYPFGGKYTAASYDLSAQICPFIEHLFDVFDGKSTLTFSYAIVGGADVTGTFLYFFISPFSFLFLIFGDGKVAHASSIVMIFKLASISVAGTWFAKYLFKSIPEYLCVMVGVLYAYCGYTFVSNTYINWMDFLIYLPFCVGAFKHFVKTNKFLPFSILVACCIYTCFSIACFSMFTALPVLVFYGLLCVEKGRKNQFIAYLCLSFVVAILLALPVLLPALGASSVSGRGGTLFENLWNGFAVNKTTGEIENFDSSNFTKEYTLSVYRKFSYIVSDSVFLVLTVIWLYRKGLKDKFAQFMLVAGALTLLPVFVDEAMNLLNMGSYMSYALRFGFLNALYLLGGACLCIDGWCYKPYTAYDGEALFVGVQPETAESLESPAQSAESAEKEEEDIFSRLFRKENKKPLLFAGGFILLGAIVTIFFAWYGSGDNYKSFLALFGITSKYFSGNFAHSLGGLEVVTVFFIGVAVVAIVGVFLAAYKRISPRLLSIVLIVVVSTQVFFYNNHLVIGNRSTQHEALGSYQILNEELNRRDDAHFRVKDYNDKLTACAPFTGGANSVSIFSSVIDADNFVTLELFGYRGNAKNSYKSSHNPEKNNRSDEFGDSFLGYKYFISTEKDLLEEKTGLKKYVKPVYALDENGEIKLDSEGKKIQLSDGGLYVYENEIVFPSAYKVQKGGFTFVKDNIANSSHRRDNQKALFEYLGRGEVKMSGQYVTPETAREMSEYLHEKAAEVEVGAGKITAKVTAEAGEDLLLNFVAVKGYSVTVNGEKAELVENDLKFLQVSLAAGENVVVFTYTSPYGTYALVGVGAAIVLLCIIALVLKKTKFMEVAAPFLSWAGIAVTAIVVAFFMLYPTGVFLSKAAAYLRGFLTVV